MTNREAILDAAKRCVCGDREQDYGTPEQNFQTIANLWEAYLRPCAVSPGADLCIRPEDVAAMLALLKIARISSGHAKADNWVDLAGYAACGGELEGVGDYDPYADGYDECVDRISEAPPAEVVEVRHGCWIDNHNGTFTCSVCGGRASKMAWCGHCGAKMDGEND